MHIFFNILLHIIGQCPVAGLVALHNLTAALAHYDDVIVLVYNLHVCIPFYNMTDNVLTKAKREDSRSNLLSLHKSV